MLRPFAMFLLMFSLLSLVVHLDGMVLPFGGGALALAAIDLFAAPSTPGPRASRMRRPPLI